MPPLYEAGRIKGTDPRVKAVTDRIGRGRMAADNAIEARGGRASDMDVNDDFARRLGMAAESPRESVANAGKLKRTRITGRGQVKQAWDEEPGRYRYHYSPEENFEGIQRRGALDPGLKKGASKGVHFMDSPDEYRPIGDRPMNVYRTESAGKEWGNVSTDDFYTREPVVEPEVYTEVNGMPRWSGLSNAYSVGSGAKGLYDMLSAFMPGVLPQVQTPADWVIQDVLRNLDNSPWNPQNTMDARTLA